ncbi:type VI secretion system tip protein VgrG, partial [Chromobacterium haemolyticum]|uniref:type VI secretion system tip protein VgrG n=1 Tax=Chromobacterium haemolyticum TaxID=394935 RepID=UPI001C62500C
TDQHGRIKVQFHWQRPDEHPSIGANLDDTSSCWLRVVMPSAGAGWGHQFIPRIGQEVLVDFIEGDIDRPVITGVLYNGSHPPPDFSGAGALPANKTLSGIKSKEHQGGQYNELLFDDTPGEVRAKLSSEPGKTQLNQGFLTHPRSNGKAEPRGDGFELRTDSHGAIRAGHGLLLSTEAQNGASGKQLAREQAQSQLDAAARVDEAAAQAGIARAQLLPALNANAGYQRGRTSTATTTPGAPLVSDVRNANLTASWELDLWGKLRRGNEAARADFAASRFARDSSKLAIAAQTAQTYFQLRAYDAQLDIAKRTLQSREESLKLQTKRFKGGLIS